MTPKRFAFILAALALALIAGEIAARALYQIPYYRPSATTGYELVPGQTGTFMATSDWQVNDLGMPTAAEFAPSAAFDVLLIGDSIVHGTVSTPQSQQLAETLARDTGWSVWPVATKSWALQNQLAFLRERPQLAKGADAVVFVLTGEDFGNPSEWRNDLWHLREAPDLFLPYLLERYLGGKPEMREPIAPVAPRDVLRDWARFNEQAEVPVHAIAYEGIPESGTNCAFVPDGFREYAEWSCVDAPRDLGPGGMRDIAHPSAEGIRALAAIIRDKVEAQRSGPD